MTTFLEKSLQKFLFSEILIKINKYEQKDVRGNRSVVDALLLIVEKSSKRFSEVVAICPLFCNNRIENKYIQIMKELNTTNHTEIIEMRQQTKSTHF